MVPITVIPSESEMPKDCLMQETDHTTVSLSVLVKEQCPFGFLASSAAWHFAVGTVYSLSCRFPTYARALLIGGT